MRLYLSGPMTSSVAPDFNRAAFRAAAATLRAAGHHVFDPADLPDGWAYGDYMRVDLAAVLQAEAVAVLPQWERGPGAVVEVVAAVSIGLPVYAYDAGQLVLLHDRDAGVPALRSILGMT